MQVIEITSLNGYPPYDISICDLTLTYCYVVATGVLQPLFHSVLILLK